MYASFSLLYFIFFVYVIHEIVTRESVCERDRESLSSGQTLLESTGKSHSEFEL